MSDLTGALAIFEQQLYSACPSLSDSLAPGASPQQVRDVLAEFDLVPPDDLVRWFCWHNGSGLAKESGVGSVMIGPGLTLASLRYLAKEWSWFLGLVSENIPEALEETRKWFPILATDSSNLIVACFGDTPSGYMPCSYYYCDGGISTMSAPIVECVNAWCEAIEKRWWICAADERGAPRWRLASDSPHGPARVRRSPTSWRPCASDGRVSVGRRGGACIGRPPAASEGPAGATMALLVPRNGDTHGSQPAGVGRIRPGTAGRRPAAGRVSRARVLAAQGVFVLLAEGEGFEPPGTGWVPHQRFSRPPP